jgi:nickel-type superoxide dismutase maturation protease
MVGSQTYHAPAKRRSAALALVGTAAATALAAWWWWRPFRVAVDGESMRPTYEPGDWLVATRRGRVRAGSIVVVDHPGRPGFELIKRVGATPGRRAATAGTMGPGEHWVLGDNPEASTDSRTFGPVSRQAILGVVRFRYAPLRRRVR